MIVKPETLQQLTTIYVQTHVIPEETPEDLLICYREVLQRLEAAEKEQRPSHKAPHVGY